MICQSKERYWTLFCPKYCADAVVLSTAHASPVKRTFVAFIPPPDPGPSFSHCHHRRFTPKTLELIEVTQLGVEQMDHEIHVVEQHPPALRQTLDMVRSADAVERYQVIRHAPDVRIGCPRRDHEIIRRFRQPPQVQHDYLHRLPVRQPVQNGPEHLEPRGGFPPGTPSTATQSACRPSLFRPPLDTTRPRFRCPYGRPERA